MNKEKVEIYENFYFIDCEFYDLSPSDLQNFTRSNYKDCKFEKIYFDVMFMNESTFQNCYFVDSEGCFRGL